MLHYQKFWLDKKGAYYVLVTEFLFDSKTCFKVRDANSLSDHSLIEMYLEQNMTLDCLDTADIYDDNYFSSLKYKYNRKI